MSSPKTLSTIIRLMGKVDPSVSKAMNEAQALAGKTSTNIGKYFLAAGAAVTTAATAAAVKATKAFDAYEVTVDKVGTIADTSAVPLSSISDAVLKLSDQTGKAAGDLNETVYQAISAGTKTANAVDTVGQSIKLAKGGFTDATTAVDTLTTVMNAYNLSADKTTKVSDILVTTQNLGKTTVAELAANLGNVIPVAAAYDVQMDNLSADLAIMTQNGIDTANAVTYTKSMLNELADTGSTVSKILKSKTGKSFTELTESGYSMGDVIKVLKDSVNGNSTAFSNLWGNVRSGVGALTLMNAGTEKYNTVLEAMRNSTGATEKAYETMEDNASTRIEKLKNKLSNMAIKAGEDLSPVIDMLLDKLEQVDVDAVMDKVEAAITWIINNGPTVVTIAGEIAAGMAGWKIGLTIANVAHAIGKAQKAEEGLTAVQAALNIVMNANPVGAIVLAITGLVAISTILYKKWDAFRNLIDWIWDKLKKIGSGFLSGGLPGIVSALTGGGKTDVTVKTKASGAVEKFANGGSVYTPRIAVVGDAPETIVPHGNTPRNRALLQEAAAHVGGTGNAPGRAIHFTYAPVIQNGTAEDVKKAVRDGYEEFKGFVRQYEAEQEAVTFG
ncbi:putative tail tape measure protein [Oscillibacter valericigenes Sjm18-20]|nr:putative tail tape measure protein [Oscillibacter valericigenes Sjm18-20]